MVIIVVFQLFWVVTGARPGWHVSIVDSTGDVGSYTSLAPDASGPRISYFDESNKNLKYARYEPVNGWDIDTVDSAGAYNFGLAGDLPASDWDNGGMLRIGVFRSSTHIFYL